VSENNLMRCCC